MSFVCSALDTANHCTAWVEQAQLIPELSAEDRNAIILFVLECFLGVFGFRQVAKLFGHRG